MSNQGIKNLSIWLGMVNMAWYGQYVLVSDGTCTTAMHIVGTFCTTILQYQYVLYVAVQDKTNTLERIETLNLCLNLTVIILDLNIFSWVTSWDYDVQFCYLAVFHKSYACYVGVVLLQFCDP